MIIPGVNAAGTAADFTALKPLGGAMIRIGWETNWGPDSPLIATIQRAHAAGFNVMLCLTPNSRMYTEPGFVAFCVRLSKYLVLGDILEVHNEPNHKPFAKTPDAAAYAAEYVAVRKAVKEVFPWLPVIIGGMAPDSGSSDPPTFFVDMINKGPKEQGPKGLVSMVLGADGFGMHAYVFPSDPEVPDIWNPVFYLAKIDNIAKYCGIPALPIHLTEFGAPSGRSDLGETGKPDPQYPSLPYRYSQDYQEEWLVRYLEAFAKSPANIASALWYCLNDGVVGTGTNWDPFMGLRTTAGKDKPVARAYRSWTATYARG